MRRRSDIDREMLAKANGKNHRMRTISHDNCHNRHETVKSQERNNNMMDSLSFWGKKKNETKGERVFSPERD